MLPSLQQIQANPEQYQHQTVVLGGQIISVINGDQHTTLEILQRPLWDSGQPRSDSDRSDGRFRAEFDYFIDPETYQSGRLVTVRGQLTGMDEGHIGEHPYRFAHIQADGIELWRKTSAPEVRYHFVWGVGPYYGYPYPYRSAVITGAKPLKHPVPKHPAHPKASTP
jgi:outer membrane lipoprotein